MNILQFIVIDQSQRLVAESVRNCHRNLSFRQDDFSTVLLHVSDHFLLASREIGSSLFGFVVFGEVLSVNNCPVCSILMGFANEDQKIGINIVRRAIQAPARQIAQNAGEDGSVIVGKILENGTYAWGYDAQSGTYGDLVGKGIIDPTKVVRTALEDAASVAGLLITTEAMVAEKPEKKAPPMPPGGGGMGGDMDF